MTLNRTLMIMLFCLLAQPLQAAEVKNIQLRQSDEQAFAQYDLLGEPGEQQADVSVAIEIEKKRYSSERLKHLSGDIGKDVKIGRSKQISWDVLKDMPAGLEGEIIWDIEASKMPDDPPHPLPPSPRKVVPPAGAKQASLAATDSAGDAGNGYRDPTTSIELLLVPGGSFDMGDNFGDGGSNEAKHPVTLASFFMAKFTVTVGQFKKFVDSEDYHTDAEKGDGCYTVDDKGRWSKKKEANWKTPGFPQDVDNPVVCVSWNDSTAFAKWLAGKSGKAYRLPTEAEWEYAARSGGKKYKYAWGNGEPSGNIADESAKKKFPNWTWTWKGYDDDYVFTAPVGRFKPNELGLYDMTGNVWQWCSDWYDGDYYKISPRNNPPGPLKDTGRHVLRGGSWSSLTDYLRASSRTNYDPDYSSLNIGFRLVVSSQGF